LSVGVRSPQTSSMLLRVCPCKACVMVSSGEYEVIK
jgi:hypothetical protein